MMYIDYCVWDSLQGALANGDNIYHSANTKYNLAVISHQEQTQPVVAG
jgi:hypothetical protein